jgi:16S rRNA processing protein RimM
MSLESLIGRPEGPFIVIASITRPQGLHGAVRVRIDFDDPRLFEPGRGVLVAHGGREMETAVEELRFQHGRHVLKLESIDSIDSAEEWVGAEVRIPKSELPPAGPGRYYDFELKGCAVYADGNLVGNVVDVLDYGGTTLLEVDRHGYEALIPFAREMVKKIDTTIGRIEMDLPEGLLDLNRPAGGG